MIQQFDLIKNLGQFKSWSGNNQSQFAKLTLIFAENAKGKTTLANILRSLANNDPDVLLGRQRIGATTTPFVKISATDVSNPFVFNQAQWTSPLRTIHVFDETFINTNVYSGMDVTPTQRSAMHNLINGPTGASFQEHAQSLRSNRDQIREKINELESKIRKHIPDGMGFDTFTNLEPIADLQSELSAIDNEISVFRNRATIIRTSGFKAFQVPNVDVELLEQVFGTSLQQVTNNTMAKVRHHIASLSFGAETWIQTGLEHYNHTVHAVNQTCPFCLQSIIHSPIFEAYPVYFGDMYTRFVTEFQTNVDLFTQSFDKNARTTFNSTHDQNTQLQIVWEPHGIAIDLSLDIDTISRPWKDISKRIEELIATKREDILAPVTVSEQDRQAFKNWNSIVASVHLVNGAIEATNTKIQELKDRVSSTELAELTERKSALVALNTRYGPRVKNLCESLAQYNADFVEVENQLRTCTDQLDQHRLDAFQSYQQDVNDILQLTTNFQISSLEHANRRQDYYCVYKLKILGNEIPLTARPSDPPTPVFSNTLSAGDRNCLAFSIYVASLKTFDNLNDAILVFDDPLSSQDENRTRETISRIISQFETVEQIIVLSHRPQFLSRVWHEIGLSANFDENDRATLQITGGTESRIESWDIQAYREGNRRKVEKEIDSYVKERVGDKIKIARHIRPFLEGYLTYVYPTLISVDDTLGQIIIKLQNPPASFGNSMSENSIETLQQPNVYTRDFHHANVHINEDDINEQELSTFVDMALKFIRNRH